MIVQVFTFLGGLVLLIVGGRLLVSASVDTARRLRVSPLVVGLTLVAWGTSAPELALNLVSAVKGRGDLALGNVVGANICNLAMVLGVAALLKPLVVQQRLIAVEVWLNAAVLTFMAIIGLTMGFNRVAAAMMLAVFAAYSTWTIMSAMRESKTGTVISSGGEIDPGHAGPPMGWLMIATCFVGGMALLSFGGMLASDGASAIAVGLGAPPALVGVTIVAIGTTLPELITSVLAVKKGQTDLAMGNALGSCLFNAGAIFSVSALIAPPTVGAGLVTPLVYMAALAVALIVISRTFGKTVSRLEGAALLGSYVAFLGYSAWQSLR